jgi:cell fate regulator YaaT (PSP1 superfamily)
MGCSTCSTTDSTNGTPAGCKSNGTCGTGGCNKLNVYNWLSDMVLPEGHKPYDVLEIRFKGSRKEFFRNVNNLELKVGDIVAVEGNPGHDIGEVSMVGELVRFQLRKKNLSDTAPEIKTLYRVAKQADIDKWNEVKGLEFNTMHRSRTIALQLGLKMKLSDVEYQGDGKKATFFYTADERVDFRELIKKLADEFKVRIEMRQIGMRQEAARLGGIGSCGRELCCSTWLTDFKIVSTSAARYQNLSLNPLKLAGQCGKLKCCLNYELDTYMDALRDIPESNIRLSLSKGTMVHRKTDIFKRIMWYNLIPEVKDSEERTPFVPENWVPLSVERVKEIIELNKRGQKPDDAGVLEIEDTTEDDMHYKDVVGQDSLTRMDRKKKKKKKPSGREGLEKVPVQVSKPTTNSNPSPIAKQQAPKQQAPNQPRPAPQQKAAPTQPAPNPGNRPQRQAPEAPKANPNQNNPSARPERKMPGATDNSSPAASAPASPSASVPSNPPTPSPSNNPSTPTKSNRPPRKFDRGS